VRYLIDVLGLPPTRLSANGFGQYQPVDPADTSEARARNRRIELKFTGK
jgi:chemotaxis protein MotB